MISKFKNFKFTPYKITIAILYVFTILLNLFALSDIFCDFYIDHIFPLWLNTYGRFSDIFPFSLGEILVITFIIILITALISSILLIFLKNHLGYKKYAKKFFMAFQALLASILLIMTLNCSILYGASKLEPTGNSGNKEYTIDELEMVRNHIINKCNDLYSRMHRDKEGHIIYEKDIQTESIDAMHNIADEFPRLSGYYPDIKPLFSSVLMSQSYIGGYYFPFSMEANYNDMMYITNYPFTYCHEYCHIKGYIYEDEANFLAFLACIKSDDEFMQYCGYLGVLSYIEDSYAENAGDERYRENRIFADPVVWQDAMFLTPEAWKLVEEESIIETETVHEVSNTFTDSSLKFFGVSDGIISYDRVTELLLQYYIDNNLL